MQCTVEGIILYNFNHNSLVINSTVYFSVHRRSNIPYIVYNVCTLYNKCFIISLQYVKIQIQQKNVFKRIFTEEIRLLKIMLQKHSKFFFKTNN